MLSHIFPCDDQSADFQLRHMSSTHLTRHKHQQCEFSVSTDCWNVSRVYLLLRRFLQGVASNGPTIRALVKKLVSKYPPAEPGALVCEPLEAARRGR